MLNKSIYRFYVSRPSFGDQKVIGIVDSGKSHELFLFDDEMQPSKQLTHTGKGILTANISTNGQFGFYFLSNDNSFGHIYRIDLETGETTNLTQNHEPIMAFEIVTASEDQNKMTFWFSREDYSGIVFIDNQLSAQPNVREIYQTKNELDFPVLSERGDLLAFKEDGKHALVMRNDGEIIIRKSFNGDFKIGGFIDEGKLSFFKDNMLIWDYENDKIEYFDLPIEGDWWQMDKENEKILLGVASMAKSKLYFFDTNTKKITEIDAETNLHFDYFNQGGYLRNEKVIVRAQNLFTPPFVYGTNKTDSSSSFEKARSEMIRVKNHFAWQFLPKSEIRGAIIHLHGGPHSCTFNEYDSDINHFLNEGFMVYALNYRGSTSFGLDYQKSIYQQPGFLESEDVFDGYEYLKSLGINNISVVGYSWGGFVALLASGLYPNCWQKTVSVMGIGNNILSYQLQPTFLKAMDDELYGGAPDQCIEIYEKSNPEKYVEAITAEMLIIHGENDQHCPPEQIKSFIKTAQNSGKQIQQIWRPYGHLEMFSKTKYRTDNNKSIIKFI